MAVVSRSQLGRILVEMGACTPDQVRQGLENQVIFGGRLGTNLLEIGHVTEEQLSRALGRRWSLPAMCGDIQVSPAVVGVRVVEALMA